MLRMGRSNKSEPAEQEPAARQAQTPITPQNANPNATHTAPTAQSVPSTAHTASPTFAATPTQPRAVSETDALARDLKDGLIGGFVGVHSIVSGETNFKGMLRVDGRVSGHVRSQDGTLIVSAGGQVDADIEVAVARVNGTINGDIRASGRIEFGRTARVNGNIQTPALVIEQGAIFEGSCRMTAQPAGQAQAAQQSKQAPPHAEMTTRSSAPVTPSNKESKPVPPPVARATSQAPSDRHANSA
ncbi:MAG: hypothetical protein DMF64_16205 [Acidobacteria bacterium]|nr:MAG: hypothetical protein DMF64_16205 [Acidobacteriota bacterium]